MLTASPTSPGLAATAFMYEPALPPSIPAGMTIAEFRRGRASSPQGRRRLRGRPVPVAGPLTLPWSERPDRERRRRRGPRNDPTDEITSGGW